MKRKVKLTKFKTFPIIESPLKTATGLSVPRRAILRTDTRPSRCIGIVGNNYKIIHHDDVLEQIENDLPLILKTRKVNFCRGGAVMFASYFTDKIKQVSIRKGDIVRFGIEVINSYDESLPLSFRFIAERLVCNNGMVIPKSFCSLNVRHTNKANIVNARDKFMEKLPLISQTISKWRKWLNIKPSEEQVDIYLEIYFNQKIAQCIKGHYLAGKSLNLWGLFNAVTFYISHELEVRKGNEENLRLRQFSFNRTSVEKFYKFRWN